MKMNQTVDSHLEISIFLVHKEYFFWGFQIYKYSAT